MLILSKYKDYYDYLSGIWGVDPNLVLDRRDFQNYELFHSEILVFNICGITYEGYYDSDSQKVYYGEDLLRFGDESKMYGWQTNKTRCVSILIKNPSGWRYNDRYTQVAIEPYLDTKKINEVEKCPILLSINSTKSYLHYPQLSKYNFGSCIDAETMYKILTEYLSNERTKSELRIDNRTDVEKLQSKGFDNKDSFRPKIK